MLLLAHSRSSSHFSTDWLSEEMLSLRLDSSSNMDTLYESLVRQIASTQITSSQQNLHQAVFQTIQIEAIKKGNGCYQKERTERAATAKEICLASKIHAAKKRSWRNIFSDMQNVAMMVAKGS